MAQYLPMSDAIALRGQTEGNPSNPTVYIVVQQSTKTSDKEHFSKTFSGRCSLILSSLQITSCICAIIAQIVLITNSNASYGLADIGAGIWCGIFFGISGGLGLLASFKPSTCSIVSFLVMSIISAVFCLPLVVIASIGASFSSGRTEHDIHATFQGILVFISLFMAVISIVSSAVSCRAICCRKNKPQIPVVYSPAGIIDNLNGQALTTKAGPMVMTAAPQMTLSSERPPNYEETLDGIISPEKYSRFN